MKINKLIIDSTYSETELCRLGALHGTDKSPYNNDVGLHKHSYTAVYDFLFASKRYEKLKIAEIGILKNKSMLCWREYFPNSILHVFEFFGSEIENAKKDGLLDTSYFFMNIKDEASIKLSLKNAATIYNLVIEDSTHVFEDQIRFINNIHPYILPGGMLIIEDIFKNADESLYAKSIEHLSDVFYSVTFIETNHKNNYSPGWDNDKLLLLIKK